MSQPASVTARKLGPSIKSPETPDPHWQIVDSKGRVFLLDRLPVKNAIGIGPDKIKKSITLPDYIGNVAKVHAEGTDVTVLGPGPEDLEAIGANLMDVTRRRHVLETAAGGGLAPGDRLVPRGQAPEGSRPGPLLSFLGWPRGRSEPAPIV